MGPHIRDLLALLHALDADPAHLVGNSLGAFICLKAAVREPLAVSSLVLEEPPLVPLITGVPPGPGRILGSLVRHPLVTVALMSVAVGMQQLGRMIRAGEVESSVLLFARSVLGDEAFERLPEEVRSIRVPALIVTGAQCPPWLPRLARLLSTLLPDGRGLEVPSATHFMHLQNPAAVNAGLLRFLSDVNT